MININRSHNTDIKKSWPGLGRGIWGLGFLPEEEWPEERRGVPGRYSRWGLEATQILADELTRGEITGAVDWTVSLLFSRPVMSDSLWSYELQHSRPPCPFPSPGVLPKFIFIALVMLSSYIILWCPLPLLSISPSTGDFFNESSICIKWPKYWSFSISSSSEHSRLISLKIG